MGTDDVQLKNVHRPEPYEAAVQSKQNSFQSIELAGNQRVQILTNAQTQLLESQRQRDIILAVANNEAEIITAQKTFEAQTIPDEFNAEAEAYKQVMLDQGLSVQGFLNYLRVRVMADTGSLVFNEDGPIATRDHFQRA